MWDGICMLQSAYSLHSQLPLTVEPTPVCLDFPKRHISQLQSNSYWDCSKTRAGNVSPQPFYGTVKLLILGTKFIFFTPNRSAFFPTPTLPSGVNIGFGPCIFNMCSLVIPCFHMLLLHIYILHIYSIYLSIYGYMDGGYFAPEDKIQIHAWTSHVRYPLASEMNKPLFHLPSSLRALSPLHLFAKWN